MSDKSPDMSASAWVGALALFGLYFAALWLGSLL